MRWTTWLRRREKSNSAARESVRPRRAVIETLEQRSLLAATPGNFVVSFYGLGGSGGFGNDWLEKIAAKAGDATNSTVRKYDENKGGYALKDLFRSIDRNHNKLIEGREVKTLNIRVVGYSFGGIQAVNFARDVNRVGSTIKGYLLKAGVPVRAVVTLDPVNSSPLKHTVGVPSNVAIFSNFYQRKGGDTKVDVYTHTSPSVKVRSISVNDPLNTIGDAILSAARRTRQVRVEIEWANATIRHKVQSLLDGKMKGRDVNHGTVPFCAYDSALADLTR